MSSPVSLGYFLALRARESMSEIDYFGLGILYGWVLTALIYYLIGNIPQTASKRAALISGVETLIERNNGIVTAMDLVLMTKVSPKKAQRFIGY